MLFKHLYIYTYILYMYNIYIYNIYRYNRNYAYIYIYSLTVIYNYCYSNTTCTLLNYYVMFHVYRFVFFYCVRRSNLYFFRSLLLLEGYSCRKRRRPSFHDSEGTSTECCRLVKVSDVKMKHGKCCHCSQKRRKIHHTCCIHCHCFCVFICCWCPFSFNLWLYTTPGSSENHQITRDFTNSTVNICSI